MLFKWRADTQHCFQLMESIGSFLIIRHHGAVFPCFVHPLYSWPGSLGTTSSPQQQTIAKLKDLCYVRNDYFIKFVQFTLYPSHKLIFQTPCTTASECCTAYDHHQNASFSLDNCNITLCLTYRITSTEEVSSVPGLL